MINKPKRSDWSIGYQCENCNDIFTKTGNFCPTCGDFTRDKTVVVRCFRDWTWYKPWTWDSFKYEIKGEVGGEL